MILLRTFNLLVILFFHPYHENINSPDYCSLTELFRGVSGETGADTLCQP